MAQSRPGHSAAVTGVWVGALTAGCLGGAGRHPVAAGLDGPCALFTPSSPRNPAPGELFRPVSRSCAGGLFALKAGQLRVRKFFCDHPACPRQIFTERLPTVAAPWARRTLRLAQLLPAY